MNLDRPARPRWPEWAALLAVLALAAVFATAAWVGPEPFGSDNDEYRMLAESLYERGDPVIAGVEGTKYPLGWSLLIGAIDRLGGDDTRAPILLNFGLTFLLVVVVWLIGRRFAPEAGLLAAALVAAAPAVWEAVWSVMPDIALLTLTAVALLLVLRTLPTPLIPLPTLPTQVRRVLRITPDTDHPRDLGREGGEEVAARGWGVVAALTALAVVAVLLKTMGLLVAGALTVALLVRPGLRRASPLPVAAALAITLAQAAYVAPYPAATTGYGNMFWLADPFDASRGAIGLGDLPARMVERADVALRQVANALLGTGVPSLLGWVLALTLVAVGVAALRRWRWTTAALAIATLLTLAVWPFASTRFALPLVPIAAVGAGAVVALLRRHTHAAVATALALALLAVQIPRGWQQLTATTERTREHLQTYHDTADQLAAWAATELGPDEAIASLDYRELAFRLDQPVVPMSYTTDADVLLDQAEEAEWFVALEGLTPRRVPPVRALLRAYPERFEEARTFGRARVYRNVAVDRQPRVDQ